MYLLFSAGFIFTLSPATNSLYHVVAPLQYSPHLVYNNNIFMFSFPLSVLFPIKGNQQKYLLIEQNLSFKPQCSARGIQSVENQSEQIKSELWSRAAKTDGSRADEVEPSHLHLTGNLTLEIKNLLCKQHICKQRACVFSYSHTDKHTAFILCYRFWVTSLHYLRW